MFYILDKDKNPIPVKDIMQARELLSDAVARRVGFDTIFVEDYGITIIVSTVFLVTDYNHSPVGNAVLFESMIFNGELNLSLERYCTWKEAEAGHKKMVELVKNNLWMSRVLDKVSAKTSNYKTITKKNSQALQKALHQN